MSNHRAAASSEEARRGAGGSRVGEHVGEVLADEQHDLAAARDDAFCTGWTRTARWRARRSAAACALRRVLDQRAVRTRVTELGSVSVAGDTETSPLQRAGHVGRLADATGAVQHGHLHRRLLDRVQLQASEHVEQGLRAGLRPAGGRLRRWRCGTAWPEG